MNMEDNDNITRQAEEIEALSSIYGDEWRTEDEHGQAYSMCISEGGREVELYLTLPPEYPAASPPSYQLSAPSLSRQDKLQLSAKLENLYIENIGESILYQWIEAVKEFLQDKSNNIKAVEELQLKNKTDEENNLTLAHLTLQPTVEPKEIFVPHITHGEIIVDRKSSFQGHVAVISSAEQVKLVVNSLMENKKIAHATHNIYAYRVEKNGCVVQDCEDDGETAAGGRLLHLLQVLGIARSFDVPQKQQPDKRFYKVKDDKKIMDVMNLVVMVSRWYGGVHLGPDRFRHINNAARQVIDQAGLVKKK